MFEPSFPTLTPHDIVESEVLPRSRAPASNWSHRSKLSPENVAKLDEESLLSSSSLDFGELPTLARVQSWLGTRSGFDSCCESLGTPGMGTPAVKRASSAAKEPGVPHFYRTGRQAAPRAKIPPP
jgi:hypothetical protein